MITAIRDFLIDPRMQNVNPDSDERVNVHNRILSEKVLMRNVFHEFYKTCLKETENYFCKDGLEIELGAGISFFKKIHPDLIVTDVVAGPDVEMVLDAQNMTDVKDSTVRAFYGLNCFHHFERPRDFFRELIRVLKPGGGVVLIEPYFGLCARPFYRNLHKTEHFNVDQNKWEAEAGMGVMSNANQALSYIVFVRDIEIFESEFPELEIVKIAPLQNYLRYLLSGGLNFRQLVPDSFERVVSSIEKLLTPVSKSTALHYEVIIRKKK